MELQSPAYYRARMSAITELIGQIPVSDEKNNDRVLLRNGLIPEDMLTAFNETLAEHYKTEKQHPLTFTELCSFNTWFVMHPGKVAGTEYVTTSREFPIMIKGTKEEIIETVSGGLSDNKYKRLRIAKTQATAKLKLLELIKLEKR